MGGFDEPTHRAVETKTTAGSPGQAVARRPGRHIVICTFVAGLVRMREPQLRTRARRECAGGPRYGAWSAHGITSPMVNASRRIART
jgi:hypothetical protein